MPYPFLIKRFLIGYFLGLCWLLAIGSARVLAAESSPPAAKPEEAAAPAEPAPVIKLAEPFTPTKTQLEQRQFQLLTQQLGADKVIALEAEGGKFIALWEPDTSGKPLGAVLMLHDEGRTLDWPTSLQNLRKSLSQTGWATLSIALPDPNPLVPPIRPARQPPAPVAPPDQAAANPPESADGAKPAESAKPADAAKSPAPETQVVYNDATGGLGNGSLAPAKSEPAPPPPPVEPIAMARIQAALAYLKQHNQYNNVLLGDGLGAARAAYLIASSAPDAPTEVAPGGAKLGKPVQALVLLSPRQKIPERSDFELSQVFKDAALPILDIDYRLHPSQASLAQQRLQAARKANVKIYEQKIIEEPEGSDDGENRLSRLVRGFLVRRVKGLEIHQPG